MKKVIFYTALVIAALLFVYPFIWMFSASLAPENEIGNLTLLSKQLYANVR
jgi:multiple sugar transport system permease protein